MEEGNGVNDLDNKAYILVCKINDEAALLDHYNTQLNEQVRLLTHLNHRLSELLEERRWQRFIEYCNTPSWRYKC